MIYLSYMVESYGVFVSLRSVLISTFSQITSFSNVLVFIYVFPILEEAFAHTYNMVTSPGSCM